MISNLFNQLYLFVQLVKKTRFINDQKSKFILVIKQKGQIQLKNITLSFR